MKKTFYEYEVNKIEDFFGKDFLEKFHQYYMANQHLTLESCMIGFMGVTIGEESFEKNVSTLFALINRVTAAYNLYRYGEKIFRFEKNLTEMLIKTDLTNIDAEYVKSPFPCIYIDVPFNLFTTEIGDNKLSLYGLFVYEHSLTEKEKKGLKEQHGKEYEKELQILATFTTEETVTDTTLEYVHPLRLYLTKGNLFEQLEENFSRSELGDINTSLHMGLGEINKNQTEQIGNDYMRSDLGDIGEALSNKIVSFVANAILYLNSDKKVVELVKPELLELLNNKKSTKKIKKLERKYRNDSSLIHYQVGKNIVIEHKNTNESTQSTTSGGKSSSIKRQATQWIVRGHWRNQAYGEGFKQRKYIWVKPYIKGSGDGNLAHKEYQVK